ncbi:TrmH family RNA methyltransferase [Patescibacteria group bacterium]|nr:TrmH family RNA methyltransferase [Patescibacteria group bacterium]
MESAVILHNIRSVHNVGSIFRTADGAGVSKIILSGYSPTPVDTAGQPRKDFEKVALGAGKMVAWSQTKTIGTAIRQLKKEGFTIVAVELDKKSISLFKYKPKKDEKLALVLGNEVEGVSKATLKQCDVIVDIPMRGKKESLNVSVAAGVAMYTLLK